MAFNDIFNFLKRRQPRRERLAGMLGKEAGSAEKPSRPVPILDDHFEEASTGVFAQIRKSPLLNAAEFLETQRTSFNKHTLFVIEILDEVVNAAIVSRKGVFLDIGFLKSYTFEELKDLYFQIVPDADESIDEIKSSVESIVSIVAYDVVYALPRKIVIIENNNGDIKEIKVPAGRFGNEENVRDLMMRELTVETGLGEEEIEYSAIRKPFNKGDRDIEFLVSWVDKEYFESVNTYVEEAGFELKKIHSLQSALFASFSLKGRSSILRVHVQGSLAYTLYKTDDEGFEYRSYDISEMYEDLEFAASRAEEVVLSGSGDYYEMLKSSFLEAGISVRWWNYEYDMSRCIIRLEAGVVLDNRYANLIGSAYYELFNVRMALVRLGVGTKLSFYEFVAVNLSLLPIMVIIVSIIGVVGWYFFEQMQVSKLEDINRQYSSYFKQEKAIQTEISVQQKNIATAKKKIETINAILARKIDIQDAAILYEIATKLPDDMIITSIEKKQLKEGKSKQLKEVIEIKGRTYLERSLLRYIKSLNFEKRTIYLTEMKDTLKTRFESNEEANTRYISEYIQELESANKAQVQGEQAAVPTPLDFMNLGGSEIQYADTLNNGFTLEIRKQ
jgi:hypothetical protein